MIELTREQRIALKQSWSANVHRLSFTSKAALHIIYNVLRGKPADTGFVAKQSHVKQGFGPYCGPWAEFNIAVFEAQKLTNRSNRFIKDADPASKWHHYYLQAEQRIKDDDANFEKMFSVKRSDDLHATLMAIEPRFDKGLQR